MPGSGATGAGGALASSCRAGTVPVAGGSLAYHRTGGGGPPMVLSHGLTDNGLCWSRFAAAMAAEFDVIMLDARGHGESSRISGAGPHDPALDIAEAIEALALDRPVVIGHSVGARSTAAYANAFPDRISKVILEDPPLLPVAESSAAEARLDRFRLQIDRFREMTDAELIALGRATSPTWHEDEFAAWAQAKRQVDPLAIPTYGQPWQDTVSRIAASTLLIYGEPDRGGLVTAEIAAEACAVNPNITSAQIKGAGHNIRRENFPAFLSVVRTFLSWPPRAAGS